MSGFLSFAERCLEIMARFDRSLNVQVQHSSGANFLEFGKNLHQLKQFMYTNSERSSVTARSAVSPDCLLFPFGMDRLLQVLFLCLKYMSAHKFF